MRAGGISRQRRNGAGDGEGAGQQLGWVVHVHVPRVGFPQIVGLAAATRLGVEVFVQRVVNVAQA